MDETKSGSEVIGKSARGGVGESGWATFLGVVCLVILFANLGGAAFFEPDEGRNAEKAREILLLNDWVTPHHNFLPTLDKPIAFYWPVALSFKLFGFSEWAARSCEGRVPAQNLASRRLRRSVRSEVRWGARSPIEFPRFRPVPCPRSLLRIS